MKTEKEKAYMRDYMRRKRLNPVYKEKEHSYFQRWYKNNGRNRADNYAECIVEWKAKHPDRVRVVRELAKAILNGEIVRSEFCEECGRQTRLSGHHEIYSKSLRVIWLCSSCHKLKHPTLKA